MLIPEIERSKAAEIKRFQEQKLSETLQYVATHSAFYKNIFRQHNIDIARIKKLEDLVMLPFTTKEDLQQHNKDFVCVKKEMIVDYVTTSGTLGDPVTFIMTENDLERLAYNEYLSFTTAGGTRDDIYQLMTTMDRRFMAGLAYFLGARRLGAGIIRVGPGIPELQWDSISRIGPTTFITVPSFLPKLIEYAESNGIDFRKSSIMKAICIGEPIRNSDFSYSTLGRRIREKWNIDLYSTYASTEMATAFTECEAGRGGHHHPEVIIVEFLDDNGNTVKPGEPGEITITTLGVEGMPLVRFKTGDISEFHQEPCSCGRNTIRLGPIIGRRKQMIKYKGTTLYPPALYDILDNASGVINYVVEAFTNELGTDEILIRIGAMQPGEKFEKEMKDHFRAKLRVSPTIRFENAQAIQEILLAGSGRKPAKFIDNRK
jgi:phenylacetate-CoA ligase